MPFVESESELFPTGLDWERAGEYGGFTLLHRGACADTYRAQKAGKYFLLKTPRAGDPAFMRMLRREYELSVGLAHPNIARVFTFENIGALGPCIVMEYIDGEPLAEFLQRRPGAKVRRRLLFQLLSALGYLHAKNIVHNDLKPENILVSKAGQQLFLIDFGLSDDDAHYLVRTPGCTPAYASPELLSGNAAVDARSDIYSVGKLLQLLFPHRYGCIARKCLRRSPSRRYRSADAVASAIRRRKGLLSLSAVFLALALLAGAAVRFALPPLRALLSRERALKEYDACMEAVKTEFGEVPAVGIAAYFEMGDTPEARRDSCFRVLEPVRQDRLLREEAETALETLYATYRGRIRRAGSRVQALQEIPAFLKAFNRTRDNALARMSDPDRRDAFWAWCDRRSSEYWRALSAEADKKE